MGQQYKEANYDVEVLVNLEDVVCCDGESLVSSPGSDNWTTWTTPTPAEGLCQSRIINFSGADKLNTHFFLSLKLCIFTLYLLSSIPVSSQSSILLQPLCSP